jgi:hypothetical protein
MNALPANWRAYSADELREATHQQRMADREAELWNDLEFLSEAFASVNGPLDYCPRREVSRYDKVLGIVKTGEVTPARECGLEALQALQRAYHATTDNARRLALMDFATQVYHATVDYVEQKAEQE